MGDAASSKQVVSNGRVEEGFDPDEPINEYWECFTLEEAQRSLFESTYAEPIPVHLTNEGHGVRLPVVISRAEPRYPRADTASGDVGSELLPDWYFEGWIPPSGFDEHPKVVRVRILARTSTVWQSRALDFTFSWQVIRHET